MILRIVAFGIASYIPGVHRLLARGTGGTDSARYCYSVWLRHLVRARESGWTGPLRRVAELGPGDSIGTGLAALLSGAGRYYAFDAVAHAGLERNLEVFDELVALFAGRADIPGPDEFPEIQPPLESYRFPSRAIPGADLARALEPARVERIRRSIREPRGEGSVIRVVVPWDRRGIELENTVDFVFSQAVLEHVDDLPGVYTSMYRWLRPGGLTQHVIDLRSHGLAREWNGHWAYSDVLWSLIRGGRPYLINRQPASAHLEWFEASGFERIRTLVRSDPSGLPRRRLARRFRDMSEDDLATTVLFVQAGKPGSIGGGDRAE